MTGRESSGDAVRMRVPFDPASAGLVRDELRNWLTRHGTPEPAVEDARLVASELVGNALRHANPLDTGVVLVGWRAEEGRLSFEVTDGGSATLPEQRTSAPEDPSGRGLQIVAALADSWWVDTEPFGNTVHAVLPLDRSDAADN